MERFIKEYANYQKSTLSNFEPEIKKTDKDVTDGALKARERTLIRVDETMKIIAEPFSYLLNEI